MLGGVTGERQERPDPEVPEKARRGTFAAQYKLDVVAECDAADLEASPGQESPASCPPESVPDPQPRSPPSASMAARLYGRVAQSRRTGNR
jgi:hypothetical protein